MDEEPQVTMDEDLRECIAALDRLKAKAVAAEDYDRASSLKKQIDTLKSGTNLPTSEADQNEAPARVRPSVNTTIGQ